MSSLVPSKAGVSKEIAIVVSILKGAVRDLGLGPKCGRAGGRSNQQKSFNDSKSAKTKVKQSQHTETKQGSNRGNKQEPRETG